MVDTAGCTSSFVVAPRGKSRAEVGTASPRDRLQIDSTRRFGSGRHGVLEVYASIGIY